MTIIRHDLVQGAALIDPWKPRIGYRNLFREGIVTVSSQDDAHPKELAYDGLSYDGWRTSGLATEWIQVQVPSQQTDYFSVAAHTLAGVTVTPQRSTNGSTWTDLETGYVVPDNRPIVWEYTAVSDSYWRLLIANAPGVLSIGALHVGLKFMLPQGLPISWKPPELNEEVTYTNVGSEGGQILGRNIVRRGTTVEVRTEHGSYTYTRQDWQAFVESARQKAVFFWWTLEGRGEIVYGAMMKPQASFSQNMVVRSQFELVGINR